MEGKWVSILHKYWGFPDFRGIQREIIESIGAGKDTLGLMPTGGGKSLTFQVPALAQYGVCIVITPLIALMRDQVEHLLQLGIRAAAIHSDMRREEIVTILDNCVLGGVKILYISPERLSSELFQTKLRHMKVSFITVDEAHCISQWGYDFRPSYLEIAKIRDLLASNTQSTTIASPSRGRSEGASIPILALTATATPRVVDDIQNRLGFAEKNVFSMSFERKNLAYIVRTATDKQQELIHILKSTQGTAIVYVSSRARSKETAQLLCDNGLSATFFHAGLDAEVKSQRQTAWQKDEVRIIVATNAFGMGIDKPDVRLVIHQDCPSSIESYFQEAGRAGRDGKKAYAVLLYNNSDEQKLQKRIDDTYPAKEYIQQVYESLAYYYQVGLGSGAGSTFEFPIEKFCYTYKYFPIQVDAALQILMRAGYIEYERDPDASARVKFLLNRHELYRLDETDQQENTVITALLRNYGNLFVDYAYIDERYIADQAGLDLNQVYQTLKTLTQKSILHFIPRRKTPYITYVRDREDGADIVLSKEVYDDRKAQFAQRIKAMTDYVKNDMVCRSRMLLNYFGEKRTTDCGHCDVCLSNRHDPQTESDEKAVRQQIIQLLSDKQKHHITELKNILLPSDIIDTVMEEMINDEQIYIQGAYLFME
ncbi:MAG: RecQ family ATP-dependent DNA helicase [Prevotella sp.]|nr:RecQ family ATP-dependent DNA helicase [Prevotella sp.]MBR7048809.1 RecQ family ATP-dependent DNA helicase [Prevotella sp.]